MMSAILRCRRWAPVSNSAWCAFIGVLCARRAMSELLQLAGFVLHEWGHATRKPHCKGSSTVGGCCHDTFQTIMQEMARAKHGWPRPLNTGDSFRVRTDTRFRSDQQVIKQILVGDELCKDTDNENAASLEIYHYADDLGQQSGGFLQFTGDRRLKIIGSISGDCRHSGGRLLWHEEYPPYPGGPLGW